LINRHNNKYSYTAQSDDNIMKNLELFDRLAVKFHDRILFVKGCKSDFNVPCTCLLIRIRNGYSLSMFAYILLKNTSFPDVGSESSEVCQWKFFGKGAKRAEVCCTSIVYATDKKQTKVEFPDSKIYDEAMSILRYEERGLCSRQVKIS
uniref:Lipocalin lipocalin n=1 Tax=Angiostrongylus cantonensis TaxID=6313 RepID=A0A0K0D3Z3_ANGCA